MLQNQTEPHAGNRGASQSAEDLEARVTDDLGGVQGSSPEENDDANADASTSSLGSPADQPAPDAGEIEWAGQLVKKPPTPAG
jgi:hypothetical protein